MDTPKKQVRAILPLLKAPISSITPEGFTILLGAEFGSPTSVRISTSTAAFDLHDGDRITLYTEVFLKPHEGTA